MQADDLTSADDGMSAMREPHDLGPVSYEERSYWGLTVAIGITIVICLIAFIWIFLRLNPFLSDFTGSDVLLTPTVAAPTPTSE
jgi:hypothetical protein